MENDEQIRAHVVSIWREAKKMFSIGGREGMLILTDNHLTFVHKTESKIRWWRTVTQRQILALLKSKDIMITHDGYDEKSLMGDIENTKNTELAFDDILEISYEEKAWGSVLFLKYTKKGKTEKFQYSVAQDWVKYPVKEPTKFMRVDWEPFVQFIKERQTITR